MSDAAISAANDVLREKGYDPRSGLYRAGHIGGYNGGDHPVLDMGGLVQLWALQARNPNQMDSVA
jgi:hypothetical protein